MTNGLAWFYLMIAIITEVLGLSAMKLSNGFVYIWPSLFIFIFYAISLLTLSISLKRLEVGFAYAIWSALGTFLVFCIGVTYFDEPLTLLKTVSLICIVVGVVGLKQA